VQARRGRILGLSTTLLALLLLICMVGSARAQEGVLRLPTITLGLAPATTPEQVSTALEVVILLTVLTLAPAIVVLMTSFTRIAVVFSLLRNALGTQQIPPAQVLIGLSLILTFFIMSPVFGKINDTALKPYMDGQITQKEFFTRAIRPLRQFMMAHTRTKDLALFTRLASGPKRPRTPEEVPLVALVPAFVVSELTTAFEIGFMLYVPFLIIDMVVASVLLSMGMLMLPPVMISLPFKLMLFVLVDGWHLVVGSLVRSFG